MEKTYKQMYLNHFTKIMYRLSIFGFVLMLIMYLSSAIASLYFIFAFFFAFATIVFTVGLVFINHPHFISDLSSKNGTVVNIITNSINAIPYLLAITLVAGAVSLGLLCSRKNKPVAKIVVNSVILALSIVVGIVYFVVGGPTA